MKNYLRLTTGEAIQHFLVEYEALFPQLSEPLLEKLNQIDKQKKEVHVTLMLPTHHVKPDYHKDVIVLKNLVSEAEKKLYATYDKRLAARVIENIKEAQNSIDYSHNNDGLVLYATESFSTTVKIPVDLPIRGVIGKHFDFSPLYKAMLQNRRYFMLAVSRQKIRLLEAFNDALVQEFEDDDFPFINTHYYTEDEIKLAQDSFEENQIKEYFNIADKKFQKYYNEYPLPVVLMGNGKGLSYYQEQMDNGKIVIAEIHGSYDNTPIHEMMDIVRPVIQQYREEREGEYMEAIEKANSANLLVTDLHEIYKMISIGNVDTLFLGNNYTLNGKITKAGIHPADKEEGDVQLNDLISPLLAEVRGHKGRIIFLHDEILEPLQGMAMIRRY